MSMFDNGPAKVVLRPQNDELWMYLSYRDLEILYNSTARPKNRKYNLRFYAMARVHENVATVFHRRVKPMLLTMIELGDADCEQDIDHALAQWNYPTQLAWDVRQANRLVKKTNKYLQSRPQPTEADRRFIEQMRPLPPRYGSPYVSPLPSPHISRRVSSDDDDDDVIVIGSRSRK